MSKYTGAPGQAFYQPSFNGLGELDYRSSLNDDKRLTLSLLRNPSNGGYINREYIQKLRDAGESPSKREKSEIGVEFLFDDR
jgi:hypothetical protein